MDMSFLIAAQRLDCNQFTYDPQEIDCAVLRAERRRDIWRRSLAATKILVRSFRDMPAFPKISVTVNPAR